MSIPMSKFGNLTDQANYRKIAEKRQRSMVAISHSHSRSHMHAACLGKSCCKASRLCAGTNMRGLQFQEHSLACWDVLAHLAS